MFHYRMGKVAFPIHHIITHGHTNAFKPAPLGFVAAAVAVGIVIHHKLTAECFMLISDDGAFVQLSVFPPTYIRIGVTQYGLRQPIPFMWLGWVVGCICNTNGQRASFVTKVFTADVTHPVFALVFFQFVIAAPLGVLQCDVSCFLVTIPPDSFRVSGIRKAHELAECCPLQ